MSNIPIKGPTDNNRVLIAQLTTNGKLSFRLNIEIATPNKKNAIKFVAQDAQKTEIKFDGLNYNFK